MNLTPGQASRVLSQAEYQMRPAHLACLAAKLEVCEKELCTHIIQPSDLTERCLASNLIPEDYTFLDLVGGFSVFVQTIFLEFIVQLTFTEIKYIILLEGDTSQEELVGKLKRALEFPTDVTLQDITEAEGDFAGR